MHDIRNHGKLMCRIDEAAGVIQIQVRNYLTTIHWTPEGKLRITHARTKPQTT
jgi:hypothetical protein